jgi:iron complex outermembrane receptor protein
MAKSRSLQQAVRFALATATAVAGAPALYAQEAPAPAAATAAPVEEVVVTGSRLSTPNESSISPITSVSATDLQATGLTRVEDVLNNLPMVFAGQNSTVSNGADGTASVNLRGLGAQRTLVLVNGRRLGPGQGTGTNISDINQVPAALVERVDVLTGGASSVYGADAVAGVVNFILNTHFQGVKIDAGYNFFSHDNHNEAAQFVSAAGDQLPPGHVNTGYGKNVSLIMGSNFADDKGNATVYATWDQVAAVTQAKYDYSACTLDAHKPNTLKCGGSETSAKNGAGGYFLGYNATGLAGTTAYSVDGKTGLLRPYDFVNDLYNFGPINFYQRPNTRWTAGAFLTYDLNPHVSTYMELMYMRNTSDAQIAASGDFFNSSFIPCNDPLMTAQEKSILCAGPLLPNPSGNPLDPGGIQMYIGRRNVEGGGRVLHTQADSMRMIAGVKGDFAEAWHYDAYLQRSTVDNSNQNQNYFLNNLINNALNVIPGPALLPNGNPNPLAGQPECQVTYTGADTACVPWNIWKPNGVSKASLNYLSAPQLFDAVVVEQVASGSVTGDLGHYGVKLPTADDGLQMNIGAEWRQEEATFQPDLVGLQGVLAGSGGAQVPVNGIFTVKEIFTELRLPLAQHVTGAEDLSIEGGYRYSKYSEGFNTDTYKIGLEWAPVKDVRFRGSYQRAVRAPNIAELFTPQEVALDGSQDPCAGKTPVPSPAQCVFAGVSAAQYGKVAANAAGQYNGFIGGNPDLKPEVSDTYSFGFLLQPRVVPNLTISADYFDIKIKGRIAGIGADTIINQCITSHDPTLCGLIHRDAGGTLWRSPNGFIIDTTINTGSLATKGVDLKGSYRLGMNTVGSLLFGLEGTYLKSLETQPLPSGASYDCVGFFGTTCGAPSPKWRHVLNTTWSTPWDAMDITLRWRYIGSSESQQLSSNPQLTGNPLPLTAHIPAYNYVDLSASFAITKVVRLQLGVNNIADKDPPIIDSGGQGFGNNCPTITPNQSSCNGNTWPGTYDAMGRYVFAHITAQF